MTFTRSRRLTLIVVAAAAVALLATGWALATHITGHVTSTGTGQLSQTNQSSWALTGIPSTTFMTLNGTATTVVVPSGQTRLVDARWVGEAANQSTSGVCEMRIGAIKGASFTEFNPISADGQILAVGSSRASRAVERSRRLGAGTWSVVAQVKRDSGSLCELDDWHFAVQVIG